MKSLKEVENHQLLGEILVRSKMPWMLPGVVWTNRDTYEKIKQLFPYLCDDDNIRHQDGHTVKWKHYVRFAQQELKKRGVLEKVNHEDDGLWIKCQP